MPFPLELANLEAAVLDACSGEEGWPAGVAAGICAGVDYAIAHPEVVETLATDDSPGAETLRRYELVIGRLAGILQAKAPIEARLPVSTDEALVAGLVGLVGDHLRIGRYERLAELRADLVLLTLLPYLGFEDAREWANQVDRSNPVA
jgi:pimeloyl-ACP methyl ester carboxylesterase